MIVPIRKKGGEEQAEKGPGLKQGSSREEEDGKSGRHAF